MTHWLFLAVFAFLPASSPSEPATSTPSPVAVASPASQASKGASRPATALESLVAELERNNPELQAARREIDMRVASVAPAGALPDPTISAGYMGQLYRPFFPSASEPNGFNLFSFSQEIPYPGKLALRSRIASTEVDASRWNYEATRRRLVADLKTAYFEYAYVDRTIGIVERSKTLLEQFRQIAESRFTVGKGVQQDVLKAQVEISLLLERLSLLEQQRGSVQAQINGLLYRRPDTPLGPPDPYQPVVLVESLDGLRALASANDATLKRDEQAIARGQQSLALAHKELAPDFGITVSSQKYTGGMPWMWGVDFMVKVPIYWRSKQRPMIAGAASELESAKQMRDNTLATVQAQLTQQYLAATTSKRLADLYSDSVLPQARLTLESSLASYQVGTVDFLTLLDNYMTVLTYEVNYEEQAARYRQAVARIEPLVGMDLVD